MRDAAELARAEQDRLLRRILAAFAVVIALTPLVALGGTRGAVLLLPLLGTAALAARWGWLLRRSVRQHGDARER